MPSSRVRRTTAVLSAAGAMAALLLPAGTAAGQVPAPAVGPSGQLHPAAPAPTPALLLGTALPDTGALKAYGPATQTAVVLAVNDANNAGGVLGADIALIPGDSGHVGGKTFARTIDVLTSQGVQAVVGPMSSELVLDNLAVVSGRTLVSPATTSPQLDGVLAHVAPATTLEGAMLAKLASQRDVRRLVAVAPRDDRAVAERAADEAEARGMQAVVVLYSAGQSASAIAAKVHRATADGLMLATDGKTTGIVNDLLKRGMPATILLTSWAATEVRARELPSRALEGALTVDYDLAVPRSLKTRIQGALPAVTEFAYSPQAYDSAAIAILAAEQSGVFLGEVTAEGMRSALPSVTSVGIECTTLARCLDLLRRDRDINYIGYTGPFDLSDGGEPNAGRYLVRTFTKVNKPSASTRAMRFP